MWPTLHGDWPECALVRYGASNLGRLIVKFKVASTTASIGIVLLALSGCAGAGSATSPSPAPPASPADCWNFSASVTEDAVGEPSAREALSVWVAEAGGLTTTLAAPDWAETSTRSDRVRFQGDDDWAVATQLPGGWMVLEAGSCGDTAR